MQEEMRQVGMLGIDNADLMNARIQIIESCEKIQ